MLLMHETLKYCAETLMHVEFFSLKRGGSGGQLHTLLDTLVMENLRILVVRGQYLTSCSEVYGDKQSNHRTVRIYFPNQLSLHVIPNFKSTHRSSLNHLP